MLALALLVALGGFEPDPLLPGSPWALRGHTDVVVALAFAPNGKVLATVSRDKSLRLWDLTTGATLRTVKLPHEQLNAVRFSGDGRWVAVGDLALQVSVVEVASGRVHRTLAHPDGVAEVALSRDGALLVVAGVSDNGAVYEVDSGKKRFEFRGRTAQLSDDGKTLLVARSGGGVALLDAQSGKALRSIDLTPEQPLAMMSRDGAVVATWGLAGLDVRLWSRELKAVVTLKGPVADIGRPAARVTGVAVAPDGKRVLVAGADGQVRLWDRTPAVQKTWQAERANAVAFSPDGAWIAVADRAVVKLWKP